MSKIQTSNYQTAGLQTSGIQSCKTAIPLNKAVIADICVRWQISEFYLFGSILRDDFHQDSDVDVMVTFHPDSQTGLLEFIELKQALAEAFARKVDLMTKSSIENSDNWIRRQEILGNAQLIWAGKR